MKAANARGHLSDERIDFRARIEAAGAPQTWEHFGGRIGVVLAGGGGRGAYEAGVLLAFQDAHMPTHMITGSSIGGINAASYAAHSHRHVGNAEPLLRTWMRLTPLAVGIDWTRYVWKVVGLIAASAGAGNFMEAWLSNRGMHFMLPHPLSTWAFLALLGLVLLYFYDSVPYLGYAIRHQFNRATRRRSGFQAEGWKTLGSLAANTLLWGSLAGLLVSLGALTFLEQLLHPLVGLAVLAVVAASAAARKFAPRLSEAVWHRFFRLPFRRGLFTNFDRTHLLRRAISEKKFRASPIRVLFTATDVDAGPPAYFSNASSAELMHDPGVDKAFAAQIADPGDLILALVATSALPMAFEPIRFRNHLYADGGLVASQPIRPAVRLGADVVFLVSMEPNKPHRKRPRTFVDMGIRALNILVGQNFLADLNTLNGINAMCERAAATLALRPEQVELDVGTRRYRYIHPFTICPSTPLDANILDFGGVATVQAIRQGYRDAAPQIEAFLEYAKTAPFGKPKRLLGLQAFPE